MAGANRRTQVKKAGRGWELLAGVNERGGELNSLAVVRDETLAGLWTALIFTNTSQKWHNAPDLSVDQETSPR